MKRRNYDRGTPYAGGIMSSDTKRDVYVVAGYPKELGFENFYGQFRRNPFANAVVMKPVQKCWEVRPKIFDGESGDEPSETMTPFERDINYLIEKHHLFKWMYSLDYRQRVSRYGGIIIVAKEKPGSTTKDQIRVVGGARSIVALRPVFEGQIKCGDTDHELQSKNFGNPLYYEFMPNEASTSTKSISKGSATLHHSRVFVFAEGADDGSIYGTSALEPVFNPLLDLVKVCAAGAEGLYKNARQRLHVNIKDENVASLMMQNNDPDAKAFDEALTDVAAGFDNELTTAGMEVAVLQAQMQDPSGAFNIALQSVCAGSKIPKTELIGFETGERSSSENKGTYHEFISSRRENTCSEMIKSFIEHLVEIGAISAPTRGVCIEWPDPHATTDEQKMTIVERMASINEKSSRAGLGIVFDADEMREAAGYEAMEEPDEDGEEELEDDQELEDEAKA